MKTVKMNHLKLFKTVFAVNLILGSFALAQTGDRAGNGGDPRCKEFYQIASQISVELAKVGQTEINKVNPLINVQTARDVVLKPFQVLPAKRLPRVAISDAQTLITKLDVRQWSRLGNDSASLTQKVSLVAHELMVLSGVEADGEYAISKDVSKILLDAGFPVPKFLVGVDYTENSDGSFTLSYPKVNDVFISSSTLADGICMHFGLKKSLAFAVSRYRDQKYIGLDAQGHINTEVSDENIYPIVYESITCSK